MKKQLLFLAIFLVISIIAKAAKKQEFGNGLYWEFDSGVLTISGNGRMCDFSSFVTQSWWAVQDKITKVVIENGITSIGNHAFDKCTSLTSLVIPNSVTSIGNHVFENCSNLTSLVIPNSVISIGDHVFDGCLNLTSLVIPNSVTSIGNCAFESCNKLKSIEISNPEAVYDISWAFFSYSGDLSLSITGPQNSIYYLIRKNRKWGLKNSNKQEIISPELSLLETAGTGFLRFKIDNYYGIVNYQGKIIIPTSRCYTYIGDYKSLTKRFTYKMNGFEGECNQLGQQVSKRKVATPKPSTQVASSSSSSSSSSNKSSTRTTSSKSSTSSNNGNSNNSTATIVVEHKHEPVPVQEWVQCTSCWGSGNCRNCAGSGTTYIGSNLHRCSMCGGRGRCTTCSGQGGRYTTVYK